MIKHLLTGKNSYKANLHTHTTVSDGKLTPEECKEQYKSKGYSVVAFSDHEVMIPHPELKDDEFLPITSFEIAINERYTNAPYRRTYHLNIYSPEPDRTTSKAFCEAFVWGEHTKALVTDEMRAAGTSTREYRKEFVQWIIDAANSEGCLVSYNHPTWSLQTKEDYSGLKGLFGVEWSNTGCVRCGWYDGMQPIVDLLWEGEKKCYPLATDDCHKITDYFGGWVEIRADKLEYGEIFDSLRNGNFYSSTGPKIEELYVEDGFVCVKTSPAEYIALFSDHRHTSVVRSSEGLVTEARISLELFKKHAESAVEGHNSWFRIDVKDEKGNYARTRAYFPEEIF